MLFYYIIIFSTTSTSLQWPVFCLLTAGGCCREVAPYLGHVKRKSAFEHEQNADSDHPVHVQSSILWSPFIHFIISNNSVSREGSPWSDCTNAQADLGLWCPHTPEDMFSLGLVHLTLVLMLKYFDHRGMYVRSYHKKWSWIKRLFSQVKIMILK